MDNREPILISQSVLDEYDRTIKDQKAEIERLTETLNATIAGQETLQKYLSKVQADTVKEFADKLELFKKFRSCMATSEYELCVTMREVDTVEKSILKEIVGDGDGL